MSYREYRVVDAFSAGPFTGNPAAVVMLDQWPADAWLQNVAMEMNLSETAYLVGDALAPHTFQLRWFTPRIEVELCGHATLAAAAALADIGSLDDQGRVDFSTLSGVLSVTRIGDEYQLNFPVVAASTCNAPAGLLEGLGMTAVNVSKNQFDYLVEVETADEVYTAAPNYSLLSSIATRGIIVTARDQSGRYDFVSRFFAPACGIDEDPVTGSAHCCLVDYWSSRIGKHNMLGYQASPRGGVVRVELVGDRVLLFGKSRIFARGQLCEL